MNQEGGESSSQELAERGIETVADKLEDPLVRQNVHTLLSTYSKMSRLEAYSRKDVLLEDLQRVLGENEAISLMNCIIFPSNYYPEINAIVSQTKKQLVEALVLEFAPFFYGFSSSLHDWYRVNWKTHYDYTNGTPAVSVTLLKNSGETVFLDSPFPNLLVLVGYIASQLEFSLEGVSDLASRQRLIEETDKIKSTIDSIRNKLASMADRAEQ